MSTNWVERKANREKLLKEKAPDVWEDARSAIQDTSNSFRKHYDPQLEDKLENGIRIRLTLPFEVTNEFSRSVSIKRRILVAFNESVPCIEVTVDANASRQFKIDADDDHAFITDQGKEITVDEFSKNALERPLLTPPELPRPKGRKPTSEI